MAIEPEWFEEHVGLFIALAPVARLENCKSFLLSTLASAKWALVKLAKTLGMYEIFPANYLTTTAMKTVCGTVPALCKGVNMLFSDTDPRNDDSELFGRYMSHAPSGTSLDAITHFAQVMKAKKF